MSQPFHYAAALDYIGFDPCHVVQFYETERFLAGAVMDFLAGLAAGQSGVAIATAAHREDGNADAALMIEELWSALGIEHLLALMCAYAMGNFSTEAHGRQFVDVCRYHSHVVPRTSCGHR